MRSMPVTTSPARSRPSPVIQARSRPFEKNFPRPSARARSARASLGLVERARVRSAMKRGLKRFSPARIVTMATPPSRFRSTLILVAWFEVEVAHVVAAVAAGVLLR